MSEVQSSAGQTDQYQGIELIYGLHDRPPFLESLFAGLQHLLAIFVSIVTPPTIIC
jgi:xanthine permease XanP